MLSKLRFCVRGAASLEADGAAQQLRKVGTPAGRASGGSTGTVKGKGCLSTQAGLGRPTPPLHQVMGVTPSSARGGKRPVRMGQHVPEGRGAPTQASHAMGKDQPGKHTTKADHKGKHMPFAVTGSSGDPVELTPDHSDDRRTASASARPASVADVLQEKEQQAREIANSFGPETLAGADTRAGRQLVPNAGGMRLDKLLTYTKKNIAAMPPFSEPSFQDNQGKRRLKKLQQLAHKTRMETQRMRASILGSQASALPAATAALFQAGSAPALGAHVPGVQEGSTQGGQASARSYSTSSTRLGGGIALANSSDQAAGTEGAARKGHGTGRTGQVLEPWYSPGFGPGYTPKDAGGEGYEANQRLQAVEFEQGPSEHTRNAASTRMQDIFASATAGLNGQGSATSPVELAQQIAAKAQSAVLQATEVVMDRAPGLAASAAHTAQQVLHRVQAEPAVQAAMHKAQEVLSKENVQHYAQLAKERAPDLAAAAAAASVHVAQDAAHVVSSLGSKAGSLVADVAGATRPGATLVETVKPVTTAAQLIGSYATHAAKERAAAPGYGAVRIHALQAVVSLWAFFVNAFQAFNLGSDILWAGIKTALGVGAGLATGNRAGRIQMPPSGAPSVTASKGIQPTGDIGRMTDTDKAPIYMHVPRSDPDSPVQFVAEAGPESAALFDNDRPFVLGHQPIKHIQGMLDRDEHLESPLMGWARAAADAAEQGPLRGHPAATAGQHFPPSHSSTAARGVHTSASLCAAPSADKGSGLMFTDATGVGEAGQGGMQPLPEELPPARAQSVPASLASITTVIGEGGGALQDAEETETGVADWLGVQPLDAGSADATQAGSLPSARSPAPSRVEARTAVHVVGPRSFSTLATRLYPVRTGMFPALARSMGTSTAYQFENTVADVTAKAPDASVKGLGAGEFQHQWEGLDAGRPGAGKGSVRAGQDSLDTGKTLHKDPHHGHHVWKFREHWHATGHRSGVLHDIVANGAYGFAPNDPRWMVHRNKVRRQSLEGMAAALGSVLTASSAARLSAGSLKHLPVSRRDSQDRQVEQDLGGSPQDVTASLQHDVATAVSDEDVLGHVSGLPTAVTWSTKGMPRGIKSSTPRHGPAAHSKRSLHTSSSPLQDASGTTLPSAGAGKSNPVLLDPQEAYPAGLEMDPDSPLEGHVHEERVPPGAGKGGPTPWGQGDYARRIEVSSRYAYGGDSAVGEPAGEFVYSSPISSPISDELEYAASDVGSNSDSDEPSLVTPGKVVRHRRLGAPQAQGWDDLTTDDLRELAYGSLATKYVHKHGPASPEQPTDPAWAGSGPREGTVLPEGLPYDPEGELEGLPEEVVRARKGQRGVQAAEEAKGDSFSG